MKITDFIKWLEDFPPETVINVVRGVDTLNGRYCELVPFNTEEHSDFTDLRNNEFAKGKPWENTVELDLGEL